MFVAFILTIFCLPTLHLQWTRGEVTAAIMNIQVHRNGSKKAMKSNNNKLARETKETMLKNKTKIGYEPNIYI